jgi:hypothetical protein
VFYAGHGGYMLLDAAGTAQDHELRDAETMLAQLDGWSE